jgi:SRSO17 transposase
MGTPRPGRLDTTLSVFCEEMLASLNRVDQRRWGTAYVRGLVEVPGRKSVREISRFGVGQDVYQSLQQFLNQSPWCWSPVRRALAAAVGREQQPLAWVVREVTFPKNGSSSVGVARQYSHSMGRMANCQLATSVFLTGDFGSCPVNWRLHLPREWDGDMARRGKSKVPEREQWRPSWQIVLDAVGEMAADWNLPRLPVVLDLADEEAAETLLTALDRRGFTYLARVPSGTDLAAPGPRGITAGQAVAAALEGGGTAVAVRAGGIPRSVFTLADVPGPTRPRRGIGLRGRPRRVLADWSWGPARPRALWLTNHPGTDAADLAQTVRTWDQSSEALDRLKTDGGLLHFEGRSFRGWHHHVTLIALAYGFRLLNRAGARRFPA